MKHIFVLLFLALCNKCFGQPPSECTEFRNGQITKYVSDGSGKSRGLKFSIKYPKSYTSLEGERPHIVRKFNGGGEKCDIVIQIQQLPQIPSLSEKMEILSKSSLLEMASSPIKALTATDGLIIDGESAGFVEFYMTRKANVGDQTVTLRAYSRMYCVIYKSYFIQITFGVGSTTANESALKIRFDNYKYLFSYVVNSFIILSKWQ
jgi:hypothetical protein